MPINRNDEKYRRKRSRSELPITIPKKPLVFRRFCSFRDRKKSIKYAAEINTQYWNYIRNSAETGRNKDSVDRIVENKDKFLSHGFLSLETTGYELLGYKSKPDYDEKKAVLGELLGEEFGISMDSYVQEYLDRVKEEDEKETKFHEARKGIIKDATETKGELADNLILKEIDKVAGSLLAPELGITAYELITGKKPEITEFGEVLKKEVKRHLGVGLPDSVQKYLDEVVNQNIRESYNSWLSQRNEPSEHSSQSVEYA